MTNYSCQGGLPPGVTSVPDCSAAIGTLSYNVGTGSVATINSETNQITANAAGHDRDYRLDRRFRIFGRLLLHLPAEIDLRDTATEPPPERSPRACTQNLVTTVTDTNGNTITGLSLDYQSTNPLDISAQSTGAITAILPRRGFGVRHLPALQLQSVAHQSGRTLRHRAFDLQQPGRSSPRPARPATTSGSRLPASRSTSFPSNCSAGTLGSTVRLPYVPNSMVMDRLGTSLYFGSSHELMIYNTASNSITKQDHQRSRRGAGRCAQQPDDSHQRPGAPGLLPLQLLGRRSPRPLAAWATRRPGPRLEDAVHHRQRGAKTLGGITGHTDTLYVYNANTGWTTYPDLQLGQLRAARRVWPSPFPAWAPISAAIPPWPTPGAPRARSATTRA